MSKTKMQKELTKTSNFGHKRIEILDKYHRSNQDTCLIHKPAVNAGEWVESGDLLADSSASMNGELAIGKNIFVAYMPWEGYNYEDAILINERLVYDDVYTSIHIERYEIETKESQLGREQITREIPDIEPEAISHLDSNGIAKVGSWIAEGDILVGKVTPINKKSQTPYQRLLFKLLDKRLNSVRDSSLRAPKGIKANVINVQILDGIKISELETEKSSKQIKSRISSKLKPKTINSKNVVKTTIKQVNQKRRNLIVNNVEKLTNSINFEKNLDYSNSKISQSKYSKPIELINNLKHHWTKVSISRSQNINTESVKSRNHVKFKSVHNPKSVSLYQKINPVNKLSNYLKQTAPTFINTMYSGLIIQAKNTSVFLEKNVSGSESIETSNNSFSLLTNKTFTSNRTNLTTIVTPINLQNKQMDSEKIIPTLVHIYLAEKRKIQVGDKMAGRHGNKGIISNILPREDMPFLPDGSPIDIVLNPLGVPSRMNVGQIYECLLGLAGKYLGEHYKIFPFDEIYGPEASRSFVFAKLFEARKKTGIEWLFDPNSPGKMRIFDGRTCECFDQPVTVGIAYMLKLVHMVDDKIHARSTGPYSLVTQQPLRGRAKQGGQRLGEMEVWAIEGYGAAFVLLEMLTIKSDDMTGRLTLWSNLILNKDISIGTPESFKVLVCELQALCLDIGLFHFGSKSKNAMNTSVTKKPVLLQEISHLMLLP